jgi:hypothetical protein
MMRRQLVRVLQFGYSVIDLYVIVNEKTSTIADLWGG